MSKLFDKLQTTFNQAAEKGTEMANIAKLKMDIQKYKGNINTKFKSLGELVYEANKNDEDVKDEIEIHCNEIDLLFDEIESLEIKIEEEKIK